MTPDPIEPRDTLLGFLTLGHWYEQHAALDTAAAAVSEDPTEWEDAGLTAALWSGEIGQHMTERIPTLIASTGLRPADAVTHLTQWALRYGIEIGRHLERQERRHDQQSRD